MRYVVEPMRLEDIDEVIEIEKEAFKAAWSASAYRRELLDNQISRYIVLREMAADETQEAWGNAEPGEPTKSGFQRLAEEFRRLVGAAAEVVPPKQGRLIGYAAMWLMVDEAHLTAIAVRREYQGRGLGELLLIKSFEIARQIGSRVMTLEVRVSNAVAQALYRKFSFEVAGLRKRYYSDNNEDAYIMTTGEIASPDFEANFETLKQINAQRTGVHSP